MTSSYRKTSTARLRSGRIAPGRAAWITLVRQSYSLNIRNPEPITTITEEGEEIFAGMTMPECTIWFNPKASQIMLTSLSERDLTSLKAFFDYAFECALPIVRELDARAARALENGDDSDPRIYRAVPEFVIRTRVKSEHRPRVPNGLGGFLAVDDDPSPEDDDGTNDLVGDGDPGGLLPDGASDDLGTADDAAEAGGTSGLGDVPPEPSLPVRLPPA